MNKDYSILLENLLKRRYDETLRKSIVSDAFEDREYPNSIRYTLESMEEIEPSYSYKAFHVAQRIQNKIATELERRKIHVDFRYQGSIQTETHILLYSGVELIILIEPNTDGADWKRIQQIAETVTNLLPGNDIHGVNYSSQHKIRVTTLKPTSQLTILPAVWMNTDKFKETRREIERGICEYNLAQKTRRRYLPFLNIARINSRDDSCNGGLKKMIRLLRTLQADAKDPIALSNYEVCCLLYGIPQEQLHFDPTKTFNLLPVVSKQLDRLISDSAYREALVSPSEKEVVFGKKEVKVKEIRKLKAELTALVSDLEIDLKKGDKTLESELAYN